MNDITHPSVPRETLDPDKRAKVLALVSLGCSRRMAAAKVPCAHTTIGRAAARDPQFAVALAEAERQPERELRTLLRQAGRRHRKTESSQEPDDPPRGFLGKEVIELLLGMFVCASPRVRQRDVVDFLARLDGVLVRGASDVPQSCPKCRRHERLFQALKSLSANTLRQQNPMRSTGLDTAGRHASGPNDAPKQAES
jgi:hypothetical protein